MASIYEILSYENISSVSEQLTKQNLVGLSYVMLGVKILAGAFMLMNWGKHYFESLKNPNVPGLTMYNILGGIAYFVVVINMSNLTNWLDTGLGAYQQSFQLEEGGQIYKPMFMEWVDEIEAATEEEEVLTNTATATLGILQDTFSVLSDPWKLILEIIKPIAWLINLLTFPLFLLERAFLLMIMKLALPLVLAVATIEAYRDMAKKWVLIYCAIFFSGLALIWATQFCDMFFKIASETFNVDSKGYIQVVLFLIVVFAKVRLYRAAVTISYKVFNS